jgi:hypothetical protein
MDELDKIRLIQLPKIDDLRGNLTFLENNNHIPFKTERCYYIYDVPGGEIRGSHAFKEADEFIVALSGSFDVVLNDGFQEIKYSLNRSYFGIFVPKLIWRTLENFSTNSVAMILSSGKYCESDYIRDFNEFKETKNAK